MMKQALKVSLLFLGASFAGAPAMAQTVPVFVDPTYVIAQTQPNYYSDIRARKAEITEQARELMYDMASSVHFRDAIAKQGGANSDIYVETSNALSQQREALNTLAEEYAQILKPEQKFIDQVKAIAPEIGARSVYIYSAGEVSPYILINRGYDFSAGAAKALYASNVGIEQHVPQTPPRVAVLNYNDYLNAILPRYPQYKSMLDEAENAINQSLQAVNSISDRGNELERNAVIYSPSQLSAKAREIGEALAVERIRFAAADRKHEAAMKTIHERVGSQLVVALMDHRIAHNADVIVLQGLGDNALLYDFPASADLTNTAISVMLAQKS